MDFEGIARVIGACTPLIWTLAAAYVFWLLRRPLGDLIGRVSGIEGFGMKFALSGGAALDAAIELAQRSGSWAAEVPAADRKAAIDRANAHRSLFEGAEILWVDDRPSNNRNENRMLRSFGALVTFAVTTEETVGALRGSLEQHRPYDVILSDISRDLPQSAPTAGIEMIPLLRGAGFHQSILFYVGRLLPGAGIPEGAFGVTNRPDQLLHLLIDALARVRR